MTPKSTENSSMRLANQRNADAIARYKEVKAAWRRYDNSAYWGWILGSIFAVLTIVLWPLALFFGSLLFATVRYVMACEKEYQRLKERNEQEQQQYQFHVNTHYW